MRWMGGYYYKLINEDNRRVSVGLSNMLWHYDKDLSGYTLGQGGYYSPQQYVSFGIPVNYRQRTENWSWELGGSVSWSYANTARQARYPLQNLVDSTTVPDYAASDDGGSSNGFGYTLRAIVEPAEQPLVRRRRGRYSAGEGLYPQPCAYLCALLNAGVAGRHGSAAAASAALCRFLERRQIRRARTNRPLRGVFFT